MSIPAHKIRNFSIVAHIDHGKSTLADRLIEFTGGLSKREMQAQVLDSLAIERERGITIKAQTVRLKYTSLAGEEFYLNLIDTPGHVDFTYEVSRSLAACEGAIVVVDAAQGVEAQTLANVYLALDANLHLVPVINKIDLPSADVERVRQDIEDVIGIDASEAIPASAKEGIGIQEILEAVCKIVPAPPSQPEKPLRMLIMDSWYDNYQGVVLLTRVVEGTVKKGDRIQMMHMNERLEETEKNWYTINRIGYFTPKPIDVDEGGPGEVLFVVASIKSVRDTKIGDTITHWHTQAGDQPLSNVAEEPLPGFKEVKPVVFSGIFPTDSKDYEDLKESLEKLVLNDSALTYEPESSAALGFGFRCGFLGLLHMEIVQERLEREYDMNIITTAPGVKYQVTQTDGKKIEIENPDMMPPTTKIEKIEEPYIRGTIHTPTEYVGAIIALCEQRRGRQERIDYITQDRCQVIYTLPLGEMVFDFYDKLKSLSKGYASFDYEIIGFEESSLVKLDILINGEPVDALSLIVHKDKAQHRGRELAKKMKEVIPRQQFDVAIQAAIGAKIIARESIGALRKNVIAKCYGGDISRKRKLLEKQKEGKKRMKSIGTVDVPQEAFLAVLKIE
ncbi:MAG TPA: translation elongation factor 4 [Bdellovibrionota bacterium]|jgi:GTP-binding protein LepA|nr:translation elongation factor 4 [Bdellovibrionota bacterium]